jgi:hypothetical protein
MGWENTPAVYVEKRYYEAYRDRDISVSRERELPMILMPCSGYNDTKKSGYSLSHPKAALAHLISKRK